jgi:hypothetical protein
MARRVFRGGKYAAFNLLLARWSRQVAVPTQPYNYVTLGGTELYDITNISWMDQRLVTSVRSYEEDKKRFHLAGSKAVALLANGVPIELIQQDVFQYSREFDGNHVYYLDFEKTVIGDQFCSSFSEWFEKEIILPGDCIFITSYLGRNPGWERILSPFEGEFRSLKVTSKEQKKRLYKIAHPLFLLYRALRKSGRDDMINLSCVGFVKYHDTSAMGLYGFSCEAGQCDFSALVQGISVFDSIEREWQSNWRQAIGLD